MSILDHLVSISEEFVWQARRRVLEQRRTLELLELQGNTEAVRRAEMVLATLERAYRVALDRFKADCAVLAGEDRRRDHCNLTATEPPPDSRLATLSRGN